LNNFLAPDPLTYALAKLALEGERRHLQHRMAFNRELETTRYLCIAKVSGYVDFGVIGGRRLLKSVKPNLHISSNFCIEQVKGEILPFWIPLGGLLILSSQAPKRTASIPSRSKKKKPNPSGVKQQSLKTV